MRVYKINKNFEKGKAIIVGKRDNGKVIVDGIISHTANTVSDNPELIESAMITDDDKVIYICGHGGKEKLTIGGRHTSEIARCLIEAGYKGKQDIYITSCGSDIKDKQDSTIRYCLESNIRDQLEEKGMLLSGEVISDANGSTITIKNGFDEIEVWVLQCNYIEGKILGGYQNRVLKKLGVSESKIDIGKLNIDLKESNTKHTKVEFYKRSLAEKKAYFVDSLTQAFILPTGVIAGFMALPIALKVFQRGLILNDLMILMFVGSLVHFISTYTIPKIRIHIAITFIILLIEKISLLSMLLIVLIHWCGQLNGIIAYGIIAIITAGLSELIYNS